MNLIKRSIFRNSRNQSLFWFECPECRSGVLRLRCRGLERRRCGSCRYSNSALTTHGLSRTPEYGSWINMIQRCSNPHDPRYLQYGARGIEVCERWMDIEKFVKDMGPRPDGFSIDRINTNGNYTPDNCRWADTSTQNSNRRSFGKSGVRGVEKNGPGWTARIRRKGERHYIGQFKTKEEAESAYLLAWGEVYDS